MSCLLGESKPQALASNSIQSTSSAATSTSTSNKICNNTNNNINSCNNNNNNNTNFSTTSSNQTNVSNHSSLNPQETCLICGDVASGKHYGLRSCEACKAFFKRTVQGKIEYSCPATRDCEINKRRRKACQACRFQKCLNMGMLKEGVRLDRVRGGRQKYRRGTSPGFNGASSNNTSTNNTSCNSVGNSVIASSGSGGPSASTMPLAGSSNLLTSETNRIMTALINCDPEELTASPPQYITNIPSSLSVQIKTLYILSDLFDRELVSLIGWAKQIPGFTETITLNDQMRLLQSTWAEVIALSIGYRSHLKRMEIFRQQQQQLGSAIQILNATPSPTSSPASTASSYINGNNSLNNNLENSEIRLVFAKDLIIDFKHAVACGAEEIFYNCVQLIKRLDHLRITSKEYMLLKAISLTNADVRLENPKATHRLRDSVMDAFYEVTLSDCIDDSSNSGTNSFSAISNVSNLKESDGINISNANSQYKIEAQDRPLSSMSQCALTSPPRPSSSAPSSSSLSSTSPQNTNYNEKSGNNLESANRKALANSRLSQVLLCLPVLRQIDSSIRKFWNDARKGPNSVPMNKLFEEMLEPCQKMYRSAAEI